VVTKGPDRSSRLGACPDAELVGAHAERRLVGEEASRMDGHLASCPACGEVFAEAIRFILDQEPTTTPKPAVLRQRLWLPASLAAAAALILALQSWHTRTTSQPQGVTIGAPEVTPRPKAGIDTAPAIVAKPEPSPRIAATDSHGSPRAHPAVSPRALPGEPPAPAALEPAPAPDEPAARSGQPEIAPVDVPAAPTEVASAPTPAAEGRPAKAETKPGANEQAPRAEEHVARHEEVTVESASKLEQRLVDAPATMSVITSEMLATTPAQNIGDTLRSVPGLNVIQTSARDINMTARQATSTLATSTLVTVDGRSVYLDFFGLVLWDFVPSPASGEIKQVEVVRGPASVVWGANAVNGVVNFITKTPRENEGFGLVLGAGLLNRDAGSREAEGSGYLLDGGFSYAHASNDSWSYKLSAGYFHSDPFSRPVGTIPLDCHPLGVIPCRDATLAPLPGGFPIGGATYPADAAVPGGFDNTGTSQPKAHLRVDQDLENGGRVTYEAGFGGTQGIVHTGIGPFALQSGSDMGYGRVTYQKNALRVGAFANLLDGEAPNLLVTDPDTLAPVVLGFRTQTYDLELGNTNVFGGHHIFTYGANYRRNNFDITLAHGPDRNEFGAYGHWEYFVDRFRLSAGVRADKFGNLENLVWSPRVSAMFKPSPTQSIRASFSRAFTAPSFINNYLDQDIQYPAPVDLSPLAPAIPAIAPLVPPPFLLTVNTFGNPDLREQSTGSYELAYTGIFGGRTTIGLAGYLSDSDKNINFTYLFPAGTPGFPSPTYYGVGNPARGVTLPTPTTPATPITLSPVLMGVLAAVPPQLGGPILLPEKVGTYLNFGPVRNRGIEVSIDHRFNPTVSTFANYSWQDTPQILEADAGQIPYPVNEVGFPPKHRFNFGLVFDGRTFFANANLNYAGRGLFVDVLGSDFAGYSDAYAMFNAALGVKLVDGKLVLVLKGANLANQTIQQHVFGDILKRSVVFELRYSAK
jgi:outer membrane receptor protein involved in Fe transport